MSRGLIINVILGAVLGGLLGGMGITFFMWQWWAIMFVSSGMMVNGSLYREGDVL